jgi:hypothetical protein
MLQVLYNAALVLCGLWALALAWMLLRVEIAYRDMQRRYQRLEAQQQRLLREGIGDPPPRPPPAHAGRSKSTSALRWIGAVSRSQPHVGLAETANRCTGGRLPIAL